MNTMSFKALIGVALIVLIVQLVVSHAEPVGHRQELQVKKPGVQNWFTITQSLPSGTYTEYYITLGRQNEKLCTCNGHGICNKKNCKCGCHNKVPPAAKQPIMLITNL